MLKRDFSLGKSNQDMTVRFSCDLVRQSNAKLTIALQVRSLACDLMQDRLYNKECYFIHQFLISVPL